MEPQEQATLAGQAYLQLRQDILTCILSPGQVVSERELARQYGMSKTPVREALTQVCHDGLMQRLPGRGYMVVPITIKDVRDLFDLRLILEVPAAERAARHPSRAQIALIKEMSLVKYRLDDPESHILFLKANRRFHLTLAEAAGNQRLETTLNGLLVEMDRIFHLGLSAGQRRGDAPGAPGGCRSPGKGRCRGGPGGDCPPDHHLQTAIEAVSETASFARR